MSIRWFVAALLCPCVLSSTSSADGPRDNDPATVRAVPPVGIEIERATAVNLLFRAKEIELSLANARDRSLVPDVTMLLRAVRGAVEHREFIEPNDVEHAGRLLDLAEERAGQLAMGTAPWAEATGRVVRGFVSRIDETVQPYGLVVPSSYDPNGPTKFKLDVWLHGRGETSLETQFLWQQLHQSSQFEPADTFVLHPYGRYSNAFKFAGEIDVLEAIEDVKRRYRIDDDRIAIRGFSMGGAGCWQMAVHYADRWYAATPGAGFSETPLFLASFQKETLAPRPWERTLWQWYDCPPYAVNLAQCPTIAYSGEDDVQKQAADVMEAALDEVGIDLVHVIGPSTAHSIHADSKRTIQARMDRLAAIGRDRVPHTIHFATPTLRYNRMHWLTVDGLERHWRPARVEAVLDDVNRVYVATEGVTALTLSFDAGDAPFDVTDTVRIDIEGDVVTAPGPRSDRSWRVSLWRQAGHWRLGSLAKDVVRKRHGLQGPIDDAFMDSFVFVRPTGNPRSEATAAWIDAELERAVREWRRQLRGDARVVDDTAVTDELAATSHLVLWGDPASNAYLKTIAARLPLAKWDASKIAIGDREVDAAHHVPILIAPNPDNPERYVVLNSGPTYREYAYLNNARQVPMLPDWALVDVRPGSEADWPRSRWPGRIVAADFFDERWQVRSK